MIPSYLELLGDVYERYSYYSKIKPPKNKKCTYNVYRPRGVKPQGRNELCACGSGKKFKKCCIDKEV